MVVIVLIFILSAMLFNVDLPSNNDESSVTLIVKSKYGSKWEMISAGAQAAANEYGTELSILAPDYERDFVAQKSLVESAGSMTNNAVIIAPIIFSEMQETMSTLAAQGVPIMSIASGQEATGVYSSLSTNYIEVGRLLGQSLERSIGSSGKIIIMATRNDEEAVLLKLTSLSAYIEEETTIDIVDILYTPNDPLSVERVLEDFLGKEEIDGIIALDDVSTIGVGKTMEKTGKDIYTCGSNIYEDDLYLVEDGYVDQAVVENFFAIGYLAVENSVSKLKDKGAFSHKLISAYVISQDNMYDEDIQKIIFPIK